MTRPTIDRLVAFSLVAGLASVGAARFASAEPPPSGAAATTPAAGTGAMAVPATASPAAGMPAAGTPAPGTIAGTASAADRPSEAALDRRIADLHGRLGITAAEEPDWSSFTAVMRGNAEVMDGKLAARMKGFGSMNAVDDLRSYADIQAAQASGIERLVGPFETLYAQLTPEQRTKADQIFRRHTDRALRRPKG